LSGIVLLVGQKLPETSDRDAMISKKVQELGNWEVGPQKLIGERISRVGPVIPLEIATLDVDIEKGQGL
jgi:hypothetical protein